MSYVNEQLSWKRRIEFLEQNMNAERRGSDTLSVFPWHTHTQKCITPHQSELQACTQTLFAHPDKKKTATFWALVLQIAFLFFSRKQTVVRAAKISRNVFIVHSRPRPGLLCCLLGDSKVLSHEMDFLLQKKECFHHFYIKVERVLFSHARRILTAGHSWNFMQVFRWLSVIH